MPDDTYKYYTYVLDASIVLTNGVTIPFMSEFLDRDEFSVMHKNTDTLKLDCETKACKRLMQRVKDTFPRLGIIVSLDGLFANGPFFELWCFLQYNQICIPKILTPHFFCKFML